MAVAVSMAFQSCGNRLGDSFTLAKTKVETEFASTADLLIDNMIDSYKHVQDISFQNEYDGAVAGILSKSVQSYEPAQLENSAYRKKINILYLYKQAIHEYESLAAAGFTGKQVDFSNCCMAISRAYADLGDSVANSFAKIMETKFKGARYNENAVTHDLIEALATIWESDSEKWYDELNRNFSDYQTSLSLISDEAFNENKLSEFVSQPYDGKHNLVEVYKMSLIKQRRNELSDFIQQIDNVTISVQYLDEALEKMLGNSIDKNTVMNYLNRVRLRLGEVSNE